MGSRSIVYFGIYALIYQHSILGEQIISRDRLPRGVLPSGILKIEKFGPCRNILVIKNLVANESIITNEVCDFLTPQKSC